MKPDLWKTFNLSVATTLGVLGIGYVVTSPFESTPTSHVAGPLAPARRAVVLSSGLATTPSEVHAPTTIAATTVDAAPNAPVSGSSMPLVSPPPSETPTTLAALDAAPPVSAEPAVSTTTEPAPAGGSTTTAASAPEATPATTAAPASTTTATTTTATSSPSTTAAPPDEPDSCLLRLWNPITGRWECLL